MEQVLLDNVLNLFKKSLDEETFEFDPLFIVNTCKFFAISNESAMAQNMEDSADFLLFYLVTFQIHSVLVVKKASVCAIFSLFV